MGKLEIYDITSTAPGDCLDKKKKKITETEKRCSKKEGSAYKTYCKWKMNEMSPLDFI